MLTDAQIEDVWSRKLDAETRALYFGDLANRYSQRKQAITFLTFFLSSGAAATLVGKAPAWIPLVLSVIVALLTAYSVAVGLERLVRTVAKLHYSWNRIATEYDRLWNHTYETDAESVYDDLLRESDLSELATTDAPNDQQLLGKWQDRVIQQYYPGNA
jgi:hypothetical protein